MLRLLLASCFLMVTVAAQAKLRNPVDRPRLEFELMDGSKLCGYAVEADAALKLKTSLGEVRVSLVQLTRIELPDYSGQAILHFANGDRLKGTLPPGIEVQTELGRMTVPIAKARSLRVIPAANRWPKPGGVNGPQSPFTPVFQLSEASVEY